MQGGAQEPSGAAVVPGAGPKIQLRNLFKVFGRNRAEAVERLRAGATRDEVRAELGAVAAVVDASLEIDTGEIFVVMGLSGSGKSTLVRMVNRLFEPTAGQVLLDDVDVTALSSRELRALRAERISMVFQHFALFPHRSVLENAAFGLETRGVGKTERLEAGRHWLDVVGLGRWADAAPGELSGGMRQRVGLARALATEAEVLLMDEAFSALDPLIRHEMQDQLIELQERLGRTIVFITHDLNEAMRLGDRVAVLREGAIVQVGTAEEILQAPADDYVATFVRDVDRSRVLTAEAVMVEPVARIAAREGAAAAMTRMRELQVSALFVLGPDRKLMGIIRDEDVAAALARTEHRLEPICGQVVTVRPDAVLAEVVTLSVGSPLPLAVVDDDDRLLGVLPRVTLLAAIAGATPDPAREPTLPWTGSGDDGDEEQPGVDRSDGAVIADA